MKKVFPAIAISISALIATAAMADHSDSKYYDSKWDSNHNDQMYYGNHNTNPDMQSPSPKWHKGDSFPQQYTFSRYEVRGMVLNHLPKANDDQQWYKVNGDYVLVNESTDKIEKIVD